MGLDGPGDIVSALHALTLIGLWFLTQLVNAGSEATVQTGGVAYLAFHVDSRLSTMSRIDMHVGLEPF